MTITVRITIVAVICGVLINTTAWSAETRCRTTAFKTECEEPDLEPHRDKSRRSIKLEGVTLTRELKAPDDTLPSEQHCQADIEISYMQMNDRIRVDTTVDTQKCAAASGEFELDIRTYQQTEEGTEPVTRTVAEQWQRSDAEPFTKRSHYPMQGASRLGWVKVKSNPLTACVCAEE